MNRGNFLIWLWLVVLWVISIWLVRWLVGGSWWLALFLGSSIANVAEIYRRTAGIDERVVSNRNLFDISDAELVRVSALASSLEEESANLHSQFEEIKDRLDELENRRATGWK